MFTIFVFNNYNNLIIKHLVLLVNSYNTFTIIFYSLNYLLRLHYLFFTAIFIVLLCNQIFLKLILRLMSYIFDIICFCLYYAIFTIILHCIT